MVMEMRTGMPRRAYGWIRLRCHRGSGGREGKDPSEYINNLSNLSYTSHAESQAGSLEALNYEERHGHELGGLFFRIWNFFQWCVLKSIQLNQPLDFIPQSVIFLPEKCDLVGLEL